MKPIEDLGISPAPWKNHGVEYPFGFVRIRDKNGFFVADVEGESDGNANANGNIIAAAPKMYEALYGILEIVCVDCKSSYKVNGVCIGCSRVVAARKAIAEASGEVG